MIFPASFPDDELHMRMQEWRLLGYTVQTQIPGRRISVHGVKSEVGWWLDYWMTGDHWVHKFGDGDREIE